MLHFKSGHQTMRKPIIIGAIVGVSSVIGIFLIAFIDPPTRGQIGFELAKTLLQVLVIVVFGGAVSLLIEDFNRQRARADAQNELRKSLLNQLIRAHKDTKRARRLLRAKKSISSYDEQLEVINDIELNIESITEEIQTARFVFSNPDDVIANLQSMANYLRDLIKEYENVRPKLPEEALENISTLSQLYDFVRPYEEGKFSTEFSKKYGEALEIIQHDILKAG
jgi:hypothetical protein